MHNAQPTLSSAAASNHGAASRPLELLEARRLRDLIAALLRKEQAAMADFLVALSDFDRRRGWEALGHASLFGFLVSELGLSTSSTYWRKSAAELLQHFPELERHLRQGRLCLTTMAELAKVLTEENKEAVLPRFLGISYREAKEIVAELKPREAPPRRDVVTALAPAVLRLEPALDIRTASFPLPSVSPVTTREVGAHLQPQGPLVDTYSESFRAPEMKMTHPARVAPKPDEVEPLNAELSRLHFNVRREVVKKLEAARRGLGHAIRSATNEQVLEAALDLLLEKQAKARGQVKRPRTTLAVATARGETPCAVAAPRVDASPSAEAPSAALAPGLEAAPGWEAHGYSTNSQTSPLAQPPPVPAPPLALVPTEPPPPRRTGHREAIPAAVRRAVWARDQGRCSWPLDSGGVCGSTHRLELDHVMAWARWGEPTEANLRVVCHAHNAQAARQVFGARCTGRYARGRASTGSLSPPEPHRPEDGLAPQHPTSSEPETHAAAPKPPT